MASSRNPNVGHGVHTKSHHRGPSSDFDQKEIWENYRKFKFKKGTFKMKKFLFFLILFVNINAYSKVSSKKAKVVSTPKDWPLELKAEVIENLVKKENQPTLLLGLDKPDEVTLKVLAKSFAADAAIWKFAVKTKAGKNIKIDYDDAHKAWVFQRESKTQYIIFVSKRKNNIETIPWLWFEI